MGWGGQPHAPAASTPGKDPVPIVQEARWAPGPISTGGKSRPHRDSIADRPARSQALYWLSYPARSIINTLSKNVLRDTLYIRYTKTRTCFGVEVPSSGSYYNKDVRDNKQFMLSSLLWTKHKYEFLYVLSRSVFAKKYRFCVLFIKDFI